MAAICQYDEDTGYPIVVVSTDSPEDTTTYIYGWLTAPNSITWDTRTDLNQFIMPPVHVTYPVTPAPPPSVRVKMLVICLVKKPT